MSQSQKHQTVNHLSIDWDEALGLWCISDPKGHPLAKFEDHYEALHYASQHREFTGLNSPKLKAVHQHRVKGERDAGSLLSVFMLIGFPKPVLGCISMIILLSTCALGVPITLEAITLQTNANPQFDVTLAEVIMLLSLSLLTVFAGLAVLVVLIRQFIPKIATDVIILFSMTATTIALRLGILVAIGALVLGAFGVWGFNLFGSFLYIIFWFIALYLLHRTLWNLAETSA